MSHKTVSPNELQFFKDNSHIVMRGLFNDKQVCDLQRWTTEITNWPEEKGKWMHYFENTPKGERLCRTENFVDHHEGMRHIANEILRNIVGQLHGSEMYLYKEKINYKMPGGGAFPDHQDIPAYVLADYYITVMVPIDPCTVENGTVCFSAGNWKGKRLRMNERKEIHPEVAKNLIFEPVLAMPGDVVFFDAFIPHRSDINKTNSPRRAYFFTFNAASAGDLHSAYYSDKRENYPQRIEKIPGKDYSKGAAIYNIATPIVGPDIPSA